MFIELVWCQFLQDVGVCSWHGSSDHVGLCCGHLSAFHNDVGLALRASTQRSGNCQEAGTRASDRARVFSVPEDVHWAQEREVLHICQLLRDGGEGEFSPSFPVPS